MNEVVILGYTFLAEYELLKMDSGPWSYLFKYDAYVFEFIGILVFMVGSDCSGAPQSDGGFWVPIHSPHDEC